MNPEEKKAQPGRWNRHKKRETDNDAGVHEEREGLWRTNVCLQLTEWKDFFKNKF